MPSPAKTKINSKRKPSLSFILDNDGFRFYSKNSFSKIVAKRLNHNSKRESGFSKKTIKLKLHHPRFAGKYTTSNNSAFCRALFPPKHARNPFPMRLKNVLSHSLLYFFNPICFKLTIYFTVIFRFKSSFYKIRCLFIIKL